MCLVVYLRFSLPEFALRILLRGNLYPFSGAVWWCSRAVPLLAFDHHIDSVVYARPAVCFALLRFRSSVCLFASLSCVLGPHSPSLFRRRSGSAGLCQWVVFVGTAIISYRFALMLIVLDLAQELRWLWCWRGPSLSYACKTRPHSITRFSLLPTSVPLSLLFLHSCRATPPRSATVRPIARLAGLRRTF